MTIGTALFYTFCFLAVIIGIAAGLLALWSAFIAEEDDDV